MLFFQLNCCTLFRSVSSPILWRVQLKSNPCWALISWNFTETFLFFDWSYAGTYTDPMVPVLRHLNSVPEGYWDRYMSFLFLHFYEALSSVVNKVHICSSWSCTYMIRTLLWLKNETFFDTRSYLKSFFLWLITAILHGRYSVSPLGLAGLKTAIQTGLQILYPD